MYRDSGIYGNFAFKIPKSEKDWDNGQGSIKDFEEKMHEKYLNLLLQLLQFFYIRLDICIVQHRTSYLSLVPRTFHFFWPRTSYQV